MGAQASPRTITQGNLDSDRKLLDHDAQAYVNEQNLIKINKGPIRDSGN